VGESGEMNTNTTVVRYKKRFLNTGTLLAFAGVMRLGLAEATPSRAQAAAQNAAVAGPVMEYEVATIKPYKPGAGEGPNMMRVGIFNPPDGFSASGANMQMLVTQAYGIQNFQIVGAPDWFTNDRFEIDAKMEASVADALAKMSQDDRTLARQKMLQALLADRFKLTIHRESKELPAHILTIGKNGSKLVEAKPPDPQATPPAGFGGGGGGGRGGPGGPGRGGPGRGGMMMSGGPGGQTVSADSVPMTALVRMLSQFLRSPVIDNTGLKGNYAISLKFMPENFGGGGGPGFATPPAGGAPGAPAPPDPSAEPVAPTLQVAVQEQLGLKLDKGKAQVEIIVIDHVEKASDN
jgi:uncharacterized protein (TIGR03435 family)